MLSPGVGRAAVKALVHKVTVVPFCSVLGTQRGWRLENGGGDLQWVRAGEASFSFTVPYLLFTKASEFGRAGIALVVVS